MNNQVITYDRLANQVKLIDGIKTISLKKAQSMGFTPRYLSKMACELLSLNHDSQSQKALQLTRVAFNHCPKSENDNVKDIVSYDRMNDKVKIFGGAITIPFKIALHKGVTPFHMMQMAIQLLTLSSDPTYKAAVPFAKRSQEACRIVQESQPKYRNKRYK